MKKLDFRFKLYNSENICYEKLSELYNVMANSYFINQSLAMQCVLQDALNTYFKVQKFNYGL